MARRGNASNNWAAWLAKAFLVLWAVAMLYPIFIPGMFMSRSSRWVPPELRAAAKLRQEAYDAWYSRRDYPTAVHKLRQAVVYEPNYSMRLALARLYLDAGKLDLAFAEYRLIRKQTRVSFDDDSLYWYASLCEQRGLLDEAYRGYDTYVRRNGGIAHRDADGHADHETMAFIHARMGQSGNRTFLLQAYRDNSQEPYLLLRLANSLRNIGERDKAIELYRRVYNGASEPKTKEAARVGLTSLGALPESSSPLSSSQNH